MDKKSLICLAIIVIILLIGIFIFYPSQKHTDDSLQNDIEAGKSIMSIQPHPDDCEAFTPGIFTMAGGDRGNKCWIISAVPIHQINPDQQENRAEAIAWFEEQYLEEYIFLDGRPLIYDEIKSQLIDIIEEKQPDILLTFTPFGWYGHPEHIMINQVVTDLWDELSYEPKLYWFVNTDQGPFVGQNHSHHEDEMYPPTDVIDLDVYSDELGKTFWEAKLEAWEHYQYSVAGLTELLNNETALQNNDRKEYFRREFL